MAEAPSVEAVKLELSELATLHNLVPFRTLILDGRSEKEWESCHIYKSRCFGAKSDESKLDLLDKEAAKSRGCKSPLCFAVELRAEDLALVRDRLPSAVAIVEIDKLSSFVDRFPYCCEGSSDAVPSEVDASSGLFPSLILEDWLWLGTGKQATSAAIMKTVRITHIVNVCSEFGCPFDGSSEDSLKIEYCFIRVKDEPRVDLSAHFERVFRFIDEARSDSSSRVLIHCQMGRSRSATLTIAYLMHASQQSLYDCYIHAQRARPIVFPNQGFFEQLSELERSLLDGRSTAKQLTDEGIREVSAEEKSRSLKAAIAQAVVAQ